MGYASNFHDLKKKIFGEELYLLEILVKGSGWLFLYCWKKKFCKILGKSINLDEIENILKKKFKNKSFFAVSNDELLKIFISIDNNKKDIINYLSKLTGINKSLFVLKKIKKCHYLIMVK